MNTHLGDAIVPSAATRRSDRTGALDTRLRGRSLILARVAWLAVVSLLVALFLVMLPAYYTLLQTVCTGAICGLLQPTLGSAQAMQRLGLTVGTYAMITLALTLALAFLCFAVGVVIFWRRSDDWMALLGALAVVAISTVNVTNVLQVSHSPWRVIAIVLFVLGIGMVVLVFSLFPTGQFVPRWARWLLPCWVASGTAYLIFRDVSFMYLVHTSVFLAVVILLVIVLFYRYLFASNPLQRQQTKWVIFGSLVAGIIIAGLRLLLLLVPSFLQAGSFYRLISVPAYLIAALIIPVSFGFAILRYRLWDIDLIIRRTLIYSTLTIVLALLYFGLVIGLESLVRLFTGQVSASPVIIVASTLAIAALFQSLRRRIQRIIDRRFYRSKYNAAKTVAAFSATLRNEVDLEQLREDLLAVAQETMQPTFVSLWLREPASKSPRPDHMQP